MRVNMLESELPICTACGSQFDAEASSPPDHCKICDVSKVKRREGAVIFIGHAEKKNFRILANLSHRQGSPGLR